MHHRALEIPEILFTIFKYVFCPPHLQVLPDIQHNSDMVALARTCHAFREPALDVLWSELSSLSPIVRCISHAVYYADPLQVFQQYSTPFMSDSDRALTELTEDEWRILRSYTSRIRVIRNFDLGLALDPVPKNLFQQDFLFPNLRELNLNVPHHGISPWLRQQHIPSLDSINIWSPTAGQPSFLREGITPLSALYPNLTKITMKGCGIGIRSKPPSSVYTWPWKYIQVLDCPDFKLDTDDLKHLSQLPSLIELTFALSNAEDIVAALSSERTVLVFPSLKSLNLSYYCQSLELTSSFLAQVELSAVEQLVVHADGCLAKNIRQFLSAVQEACNNRPNGPINVLQSICLTDVSLMHWQMSERWDSHRVLPRQSDMETLHDWASQRSLTLEDLRPSMAFTNIRHVELDIVAHIHLTDDAVLELASAWPFLEHLSINETTGWNHPGSIGALITLDGLQQLLLKCPLLNHIGLAIHTPITVEAAAQSMATTNLNSRSNLPGMIYINVMDSIIEEISIPAVATSLARVVGPYDDFKLKAWGALSCCLYSDTMQMVNRVRWNRVRSAVKDILGRSY